MKCYISIILSVFAIIISCSDNGCFNLGDTANVLSILVTLLIGWNIYSALGIDRKMTSINNLVRKLRLRRHRRIMERRAEEENVHASDALPLLLNPHSASFHFLHFLPVLILRLRPVSSACRK